RQRRRHPLQPEDEQEGSDEIRQVNDPLQVHGRRSPCARALGLNISSIRFVTTYPPAALPAPSSTPTKPIACCTGECALSSAYSAPTTTMPCTKFEPDISGVCRIAGTRPMISMPVKAASITMYSAMNPTSAVSMGVLSSGRLMSRGLQLAFVGERG